MGTTTILMTVGGIIMLAALAVLRRSNVVRGKCQAVAAAAVHDYRRMRDKADLGLVCPNCEAHAEPLEDTQDRYRCVDCRYQFAAELHYWKSE